jgi:hypothetical protein
MSSRADQTLHMDPTLDRNASQSSILSSRSTSNSKIIRLKHQELYNQAQNKHNIPRQKSLGAGPDGQGTNGPAASVETEGHGGRKLRELQVPNGP